MHNRFCVTFVNHAPTGLNEANRRELCAQVNIIFHSAATVSDPPPTPYLISMFMWLTSTGAFQWVPQSGGTRQFGGHLQLARDVPRNWEPEGVRTVIWIEKSFNEIFNEHLTASNKHEVACTLLSLSLISILMLNLFFAFPELSLRIHGLLQSGTQICRRAHLPDTAARGLAAVLDLHTEDTRRLSQSTGRLHQGAAREHIHVHQVDSRTNCQLISPSDTHCHCASIDCNGRLSRTISGLDR